MKKILLSFLLCISVASGFLPCFTADVCAVAITGISAKAYVLIDAQTGVVIASKNENQKLPMASTTKIMTTLLMLESGDLDTEFVVDSEAIKTEGSSMGLVEGDIVTKRALCYGMMLPSGNDAANSTAIRLAGGYEEFSRLMNCRAAKIGMKNTNFVTPSGLHANEHYSTAYDMALLTREALKNDDFKEISGTKSIKLSFGNPPYDRWLTNTNKLLSKYPYCIGVKTGFTDEAGRCLVSAAEKDGITLICVTLNDPADWNDHITLFDYGFSSTAKMEIPFKFDKTTVDVAGGTKNKVSICLDRIPLYTAVNDKTPKITAKIIIPNFIYAPVKSGDSVGYVRFYIGNDMIEEVSVIAGDVCDAVIKPNKPSAYSAIIDFFKGLIQK